MQLVREHDRPGLARVRPRLPAQAAAGRVRRADPERAELVVLRRAVVRDDAVVGEDRPPAERELRRLRRASASPPAPARSRRSPRTRPDRRRPRRRRARERRHDGDDAQGGEPPAAVDVPALGHAGGHSDAVRRPREPDVVRLWMPRCAQKGNSAGGTGPFCGCRQAPQACGRRPRSRNRPLGCDRAQRPRRASAGSRDGNPV